MTTEETRVGSGRMMISTLTGLLRFFTRGALRKKLGKGYSYHDITKL